MGKNNNRGGRGGTRRRRDFQSRPTNENRKTSTIASLERS